MVMKKAVGINHAFCRALDRIWPYPLARSFWDTYAKKAAALASDVEPAKIVDIGAGRTTPYAKNLSGGSRELIGIDLLKDDLDANHLLTHRIVHNVMNDGLPSAAHNAGLITSRMVLEHLSDLERFAQETHDALAPGGWTIHLFAGRYSLFAILNRLLPESISRRVLFALRPESVEVGGFRTYYNHTNALAAEVVFRDAGLVDIRTEVSYQVSQYFRFFFPLFVLARLWETVLHALGLKNMGAYVLLQARRPLSKTNRSVTAVSINEPQ
jgi:SAM-dependent methyltransferase